MSKLFQFLLIFTFLIPACNCFARVVADNGTPVSVRVARSGITEIRFEGENIASIVLGLNQSDLSIERMPDALFIKPLVDNVSGDLYVITRSGKSINLNLISVSIESRDRNIKIVNNVESIKSRVQKLNQTGITPAGLIKAMVLEEDMDGVTVSPSNILFLDNPIQLMATFIYDAVFLKGYVIDMRNHDNFDIKNLSMKGLIAGALYKGNGYFVVQGDN